MMWKFINFQLRRWREHSSSQPQSVKKKFVTAKGKTSRKERGLYFQVSCYFDVSKATSDNREPLMIKLLKKILCFSLIWDGSLTESACRDYRNMSVLVAYLELTALAAQAFAFSTRRVPGTFFIFIFN